MNELEIIRHPQMDGLSMFFNRVDYRTPHLHPEWELLWVLENTMVVRCGQEEYVLEPGNVIVFNPNEPHEFRKGEENTAFLCLQISPKILPKIPDSHLDGRLLHQHMSLEELREIKRYLLRCMRSYLKKEPYFELYCGGIATMLVHDLLTKLPSHVLSEEEQTSMDKRNARLKRLIEYVDENYMHKIRLTDFAKMENCSMSYLSRFITNAMNLNFQEYVTSVRFSCACKMIATEDKKLLEICMESGFSDYRYFSNEFKSSMA